MKRTCLAVAAAAAMALAAPASASHDDGRTVEGSVLLPTFYSEDLAAAPGIATRQGRCAYEAGATAGVDTNGIFAYTVELDEAEGDGEHAYALSSDKGDPAVMFYGSIGTCDGNNPSVNGWGYTEGAEDGQIPFGTTHAMIFVEGDTDVAVTFEIS